METILIVVTGEKPNKKLLADAKRYATGIESQVVLCDIREEGFHQNSIQRHSKVGREAEEIDQYAAETAAAEIAEDAFGDEIPYEVVGVPTESASTVLEIAEEYGCDRVFIDARKRTAVGKAIFGDLAQTIILQFDGPVTVTTES
ncbi:universal stress protein [Halocatena salina]|uniref:Universal stress protein n=1 Tax=Halocatena salina TaxID=2934340 RepID=A0A8U0A6H7_9EURY|nr:universal stress protein [Halocatena salina]UPM44469.1 universal stress protein [Halocatena salina]